MRERSQRFDPRQVMHADTFEIFHYKEPRPDGVEVHHHDFYEVYFLLNGQVEYWVDGRILRLQPGDLLLISPLELHRPLVDASNPVYERIVLWINKQYLEGLADDAALSRCFAPEVPNLICPDAAQRTDLGARFHELIRENYSTDFGSDLCARGLFLQLMVILNRLALYGKEPPQEEAQLSELVQRTLDHISQHIREEMTLESIASAFYVSKYHLSHTFTREMGVSIHRYIMLKRLLMARQLLLTGIPAGQACRLCGFADYTSFYRAFKGEYGISPKTFSSQ